MNFFSRDLISVKSIWCGKQGTYFLVLCFLFEYLQNPKYIFPNIQLKTTYLSDYPYFMFYHQFPFKLLVKQSIITVWQRQGVFIMHIAIKKQKPQYQVDRCTEQKRHPLMPFEKNCTTFLLYFQILYIQLNMVKNLQRVPLDVSIHWGYLSYSEISKMRSY